MAFNEITALIEIANAIKNGHVAQADDALKLGGVLASSFWNDNNCTKSIGASSGWEKLKSGKLHQYTGATVATGGYIDVVLPIAHANALYMVQVTPYGGAVVCGASQVSATTVRVFAVNGAILFVETVGQ